MSDEPTEGWLAVHYPNNGRPWSITYPNIPAVSVAECERRVQAERDEGIDSYLTAIAREKELTKAAVAQARQQAFTDAIAIVEAERKSWQDCRSMERLLDSHIKPIVGISTCDAIRAKLVSALTEASKP